MLAPTRELALQIDRTVQPIARSVGLYTTQIVGGVPQQRQTGALAKGVDIVIGTPGRIEDLLEQGRLDLSAIEIAVLDEADHMAELGFLEPMQRLLRRVPASGQRLLFSATLDAAVSRLVEEFLPDPAVHEVADAEGAGTADHRVLVIEQGEKLPVLDGARRLGRALARVRPHPRVRRAARGRPGRARACKTESLHGDLNQARRTRNLARFSEGKVSALVATDVAARGIHVDDIELVVHADSAEDYKTYLHRSGRTGRAGASGTVVTLITARRRRRFTELLERAGIEAEFVVLHAGDDPVAAHRPMTPAGRARRRRLAAAHARPVRGGARRRRAGPCALRTAPGVAERDELFRSHPASPLLPEDVDGFAGLDVPAYDAQWAFEAEVEEAPSPRTSTCRPARTASCRSTGSARAARRRRHARRLVARLLRRRACSSR